MEMRKSRVYKRKDDRYEGRVLMGYVGVYGKAVYRSVYGHTEKEVITKMEELEKRVQDEVDIQQTLRNGRRAPLTTRILEQFFLKEVPLKRTLSVKEWLEEWLEFYKKNTVRVSSYARYRTAVYKHIVPQMGDQLISEITPDEIQLFIKYLYERAGKNGGLAPATVRSYYNILKTAFEAAVQQEIINRNPCVNISLPQNNKNRPDYLDAEEYRKLMGALKNAEKDAGKAAILVALKTGLRLGEIAALRWENIDFIDQTIHVRASLQRIQTFTTTGPKTKLCLVPTKTDYSIRDIPMNRSQYLFFKKYLHVQQEKFNTVFGRDTYLFLDRHGNRMDPRMIQYNFKKILEEAKIRPIKFHGLRHTFATVAASKNMQVSALSRILGHANVTLTLERYVHSLTNQDRKEMAKIEWNYA